MRKREEFVRGSEYVVAKQESPRIFVVAMLGYGVDGSPVLAYEIEHKTKAAAVEELKKILKMFPGIDISYVDVSLDNVP